jgi:hypothetical protein
LLTDILFDATEVSQGQVLVGYITYDNNAERVWKHVENVISRNAWEAYSLGMEAKQYIGGFLKFFSKQKNKTYLNTLYGPLGLPRRFLKPGETDDYNNILPRTDIKVVRTGSTDFWNELKESLPYIWVINEFGDLVLGEDIYRDNGYQGHPTLVDGKAARLGGELYYSAEGSCWFVNLKSRAYSGHIVPGSPLWSGYLKYVVQENFKGKVVRVEAVLS